MAYQLSWVIYCQSHPCRRTAVVLLTLAQLAGAVEYTDCFSAEGSDPLSDECPRYTTKQSDGEIPVVLGLPSLPMRPGPLWPGIVVPDRALSIG